MNCIVGEDIINSATPLEQELAGAHPRLHVDAAGIERLRQRRDDEPWASMLTAARRAVDRARANIDAAGSDNRGGPGGQLPHIALSYLIFGEGDDLELARHIMHATCRYDGPDGHGSFGGCWLFALGIAFDWLYHDLDRITLDETAAYIDRRGRQTYESLARYETIVASWYTCNHLPNCLYDLAAGGMAIYGHRPDMGPWIRFVLEKTRQMIHALGPDGASQEGICYGGFYTDYFVRTVDLVHNLLGVDLFAPCDWLANTWTFHRYSMLPRQRWAPGSCLMCFGDGVRHHWHGPDNFLFRLGAYHHNGHAQWLASELFAEGLTGGEGHFLNPIWFDPSLKELPPDDLPAFYHFQDQGLVFMRSGWDGDEAVFGFRCAPFSGHHAMAHFNSEVGGGHMHPDAGSFQLFAHGDWLITDAGYCRKQTAYRNTVLINGVGQTGENSEWFEGLQLRRDRRGPRILHAESHDAFDRITADLTAAYEPAARAVRLIRHIVYLKPDCWIIIDDLAAAQDATFELLFHADQPFTHVDDARYATGGKHGALLLTLLHPSKLQIKCEKQAIIGIGAHGDKQMDVLRVCNALPQRAVVFVTMLQVHPADSPATARGVVERDQWPLLVEVVNRGQRHQVLLKSPGHTGPIAVYQN